MRRSVIYELKLVDTFLSISMGQKNDQAFSAILCKSTTRVPHTIWIYKSSVSRRRSVYNRSWLKLNFSHNIIGHEDGGRRESDSHIARRSMNRTFFIPRS